MISTEQLRRCGDFLLEQKRIRLLLHVHPDGDVLGSCLGLYLFLRKKGLDVGVLGPFTHPGRFDFLPGFGEIHQGREEARDPDFADTLYAVIDSTGVDRTGFREGDFQRLLRIDHHIDGSTYREEDLTDTTAAATTLIITALLRELDEAAIDADIATCLYTGLMTDTGGFRYSSTGVDAFSTAAFLVERGADPGRIAGLVNDRRDPSYLQLLANALASLSYHAGGRIALLVLKADDLPAQARPFFGEDDFMGLPRSLESVEVVVQMKLASGESEWKIGFRGKGRVNVQEVAASFGGGGHFSASGCEVEGEEEALREEVILRLTKALAKSGLPTD